MVMYMDSYPTNPKMDKWIAKNEDEQSKIAEQNEWSWYFRWGDIGNELRYEYERVDKDPQVKNKYGGYDGWDKPKKQGEEYAPCSNKECPYYNTETWGENRYKGANCSYWGDTDRMFECGDELFVLIQQWIDVCGIEALDQLKEEWNIHSDIIGWFKYGDDYFTQKERRETMKVINDLEEAKNFINETEKMGIRFQNIKFYSLSTFKQFINELELGIVLEMPKDTINHTFYCNFGTLYCNKLVIGNRKLIFFDDDKIIFITERSHFDDIEMSYSKSDNCHCSYNPLVYDNEKDCQYENFKDYPKLCPTVVGSL